jgi:hypothetical protein
MVSKVHIGVTDGRPVKRLRRSDRVAITGRLRAGINGGEEMHRWTAACSNAFAASAGNWSRH